MLRVYKDRATGRDRWVTITTTAYEDRDQEIITTKGIAHAVAHGDATGERGVLRVWHVPGMDLGDCDYQAQGGPGGRWLIESGTFYGPREARVGALMAAKGWQMSPGFLHPASEPYQAEVGGRMVGLFDSPVIFERSTTPPGRASNLFGRFMTKEQRMLTDEKRAQLKALVDGDDDLLAGLLARVEQTDKAAQAAGVAFKDAPEWAQVILQRLDALEATQKAAMPAEEMVEAGETEADDGEVELMADDVGEVDDLLRPEEIERIAQRVVELLAPQLGEVKAAMDIKGAMAAHMDQLKGLMGGYATKDDTAAQLKALAADVATLKGDAPAATQRALGIGVPSTVATETVKALDEHRAQPADGSAAWTASDPVGAFLAGFDLGNLNGAAR